MSALNVASETSVKWDKFKSIIVIKSKSERKPSLEISVCQDKVNLLNFNLNTSTIFIFTCNQWNTSLRHWTQF